MTNSPSGLPQMNMNKLLPVAIVGLIGLAAAAAIVGNWVMDVMDSSFRTTGRYAKQLEVPAVPPEFPKDTYLCPPNAKNPWIGCTIR